MASGCLGTSSLRRKCVTCILPCRCVRYSLCEVSNIPFSSPFWKCSMNVNQFHKGDDSIPFCCTANGHLLSNCGGIAHVLLAVSNPGKTAQDWGQPIIVVAATQNSQIQCVPPGFLVVIIEYVREVTKWIRTILQKPSAPRSTSCSLLMPRLQRV